MPIKAVLRKPPKRPRNSKLPSVSAGPGTWLPCTPRKRRLGESQLLSFMGELMAKLRNSKSSTVIGSEVFLYKELYRDRLGVILLKLKPLALEP